MTDLPHDNRSAGHTDSTEPLVYEIIGLFAKIQRRMQQEDDEEKDWMIRHSRSPEAIAALKETTVTMLHVLDAIGWLEPANGITLSKHSGIPKGSVSKITRKLVELGLARKQFLPNNKKEVLFGTTALGRELYELHLALHREIEHGVKRFLGKYEPGELRFFVRVLQDSLTTSWVRPASEEKLDARSGPDRV